MAEKDREARQLDRSVGMRLKHSREEKGLSLSELCKLIAGIPSPSYLNRFENGERRAISTKLLMNWCDTLGVSFFHLLNVPEDSDEERTLLDLLAVYQYTLGEGIDSNPEIGKAIFQLVDQVVKSDLKGDKAYADAILILERAKELSRLLEQA